MKTIQLTKLIADDGMILTDGTQFVHAVIIRENMSIDDWQEITEKYYAKLMAKMTPREFILALLDKGITKASIEEIMEQNDRVWAELSYATIIIRTNPLLDQFCGYFDLTPEDVDALFGL